MKKRSLFSLIASLVVLSNASLPVNAQRSANSRPSAALVSAIRETTGSEFIRFFDQIEYFFTEVDLNNDRSKEVVVYSHGPNCGVWRCYVYIFQKRGRVYRLVGNIDTAPGGGVSILSSRSNGWRDIATFDIGAGSAGLRSPGWDVHRFNGRTYPNQYPGRLRSEPRPVILQYQEGRGIRLSAPGVASP